jgi:TolA-binding protein
MTTHLAKHSKLTKRQIKEDPLVTAAYRGLEIWERNSSRILIGAGVLVLVAILAFFVLRARSQAEVRAADNLFRATIAVSQGDYVTAAPMLEEIVNAAPGTRAARQAMLYLGDALAAQKKPGEAATWYRKYLDRTRRDRVMQQAGYFALGAALEDAGQFGEAASAYAESAKRASTDNERGRAMLSQGRSLLRAGQSAKAVEVYQAILALARVEQPIADAAQERLGEIQAPSTPTP